MPTMNVSLTPELMQLVQSKVASGMYNNASEFIREAIRNVDGNERLLYELKLARLKEALLPGIAEADMMTVSPFPMLSLCVAVAMRKSPLMGSPWLPVVITQICSPR